MGMLDVFKTDAYNTFALTAAIDKLPYRPKRIGQLGLFKEKGIDKTVVGVEERNGKLSLLMTAARGSQPQGRTAPGRKLRTFSVPHIPHDATVMADEVQNVREFGSEDASESVARKVNDRLAELKADHETTWEWHRVCALHGILLDGDGTTQLLNLFTAFDVTEVSVSFDFSTGAADPIKKLALEVIRSIEDSLGDDSMTGVHAICGNTFFDNLITCDEAKEAFDRWQDGKFLRETQRPIGGTGGGFQFADIFWENYRGSIGGTKFVADDECRFFPTGTNDIFHRYNAPADFVEAVNTTGKALYAKQEVMKFDKGIEIHTQSNPLHLVTRPEVLVKGLDVTPVST